MVSRRRRRPDQRLPSLPGLPAAGGRGVTFGFIDAPAPRYGEASLADLTPSLLAALGVPGLPNPLGLAPAARACLLLVDGLGLDLLLGHPQEAPFMAGLAAAREPLTTGFPSSTAVSIASLGTGKPPGEHGVVGFTMAIPGFDRAMNALRWTLHGPGPHVDLRETVVPEEFQPEPTRFETARDAGVGATVIGPFEHRSSGLTRVALRGAEYRPSVSLGDLAAETVAALGAAPRAFVYAYHPDLDMTGHVRGVGSQAWRRQLSHVDRLVQDVASSLPKDSVLLVTGDHGMVDIHRESWIDLDQPRWRHLREGARMIAGEPRARHVYARPGGEREALAAWREAAGGRAWVLEKEAAVEAGWFGPSVTDAARERIGDVLVAARGDFGVVQPSVFSLEALMVGHHGSLTDAERLVPRLEVRV